MGFWVDFELGVAVWGAFCGGVLGIGVLWWDFGGLVEFGRLGAVGFLEECW